MTRPFSPYPSKSHEVAKKLTVEEMIAMTDEGRIKLHQAIKLQKQAHELFKEVRSLFSNSTRSPYDGCNYPREVNQILTHSEWPLRSAEKVLKEQNHNLWVAFFENSPLWNILDHEERRNMLSDLERNAPEFTYKAALSTTLHHNGQALKYFRRGLVNSFKHVVSRTKTPYRNGPRYKSNDAFKLSKKVIFRFFEMQYFQRSITPAVDILRDIERSFLQVDGKQLEGESVADILKRKKDLEPFENEYFEIRSFQNGNIHVIFKRPDLVKKINQEIVAYYGDDTLAKAT